jgi:hypothetical protein
MQVFRLITSIRCSIVGRSKHVLFPTNGNQLIHEGLIQFGDYGNHESKISSSNRETHRMKPGKGKFSTAERE